MNDPVSAKSSLSPWRIYAPIALFGVAVLIALAVVSRLSWHMVEHYSPLVEASLEIKYEASLFHLWFEESIGGDEDADIGKAWGHLDKAGWYAKAMLEGGENSEGRFIPLDDPLLREDISTVLKAIGALRLSAEREIQVKMSGGDDSRSYKSFDAAFNAMLVQADHVEETLKRAIAKKLSHHKFLTMGINGALLLLLLGVGIAIARYERRRIADDRVVRESEVNLSSILGSIGEGVIATDSGGRITHINRVARDITGVDEAVGAPIEEVFHIVDATSRLPLERPVSRVMREGTIQGAGRETILISRLKKEYRIAFTATPIMADSGGSLGVVIAFRDVTEKYAAGEALRLSRAKYQDLFDNAPDMYASVDAETTKIIECNRTLTTTLGYTKEELIGRSVFDIYHPDCLSDAREHFLVFVETGYVHDEERQLRRKDGSKVYVSLNVSSVRDEHGRVLYSRSVWRDITEKKMAEGELIANLEGKNAEMERFTYTVSHDLKSPLITIRGFLGLLRKDKEKGDWERMEHDMERIDTAAKHMEELLNDLLELSRIGRIVNPSAEVSLGDIASGAVKLLSGHIKEKGIAVEIAPDLPAVFADQQRIGEVYQNLIENAVKYMGDQKEPRIDIGMRREGDETAYYVRDNGIGIDPKYHEKVFGLFERLNHGDDGTGIGLAIVKRIIELHGGRIWVESEGEGKGSAFCFTLPKSGGG